MKKVISLLMSLVMLCTITVGLDFSASAAGGVKTKLDAFIAYHPSGARWTDSFDGGSQCYGFAKFVVYNVFGKSGSSYRTWKHDGTPTIGMSVVGSVTSFSSANVKSLLSKAKTGDVLQFNTTKQHSMIVYSVVSDGVYIYDCNWDNNCGISKRKSSFGAWSGRNSTKLTLLRASNYTTVDGSSHIVNTNYEKNFIAYPKSKITASNIFDENHNSVSSTAWIGTSDKCTIKEVYTDGCCKVVYPLSSGGTNTVFSKISLFTTHKHNYSGQRVYEAAHPHEISQRCVDYANCGGYYWTGEQKKVSTCEKCWNIDWYSSESNINIKTGQSKTIRIWIDAATAVFPNTAQLKTNYNSSIVDVTSSGQDFTFVAKKAGSCTYSITVYSDSTYTKAIATLKIPITVSNQTYTVKYNANGGSGAPTSQTKIYGKTLTLTNTQPVKEGYTFIGWSTSSSANSATYQSGGSYIANANVTLYAVWRKNHVHSFTEKITKNPTCIENGEKTIVCNECGAKQIQQIPKTSHSYVIDEAIPATCTKNGKTQGSHCSICGYVASFQAIDYAKGHDFGNNSPTCLTCGIKNVNYIEPIEPTTKPVQTTMPTTKPNGTTKPATKPTERPTNPQTTQPMTEAPTQAPTQPVNVQPTTQTLPVTQVPTQQPTVPVTQPSIIAPIELTTQAIQATVVTSKKNKKITVKKPKKATIKKLKKAKKSFKVYWKKLSGVTGYQIQYSTSKKFSKKTTKTVTVKGNKTTSKTIKKLKGGKKYYVRVRAFNKAKVNGKTKTAYGSWSKVKTVTTKK